MGVKGVMGGGRCLRVAAVLLVWNIASTTSTGLFGGVVVR